MLRRRRSSANGAQTGSLLGPPALELERGAARVDMSSRLRWDIHRVPRSGDAPDQPRLFGTASLRALEFVCRRTLLIDALPTHSPG